MMHGKSNIKFYDWFLLSFNETYSYVCKCVNVLHTTDRFESTTLTTVKAPWWWHPWSTETCRRRFCASVVYMLSSKSKTLIEQKKRPQRVVALQKHPQSEISCCGCF